jgi:flagellar hook-length control protein FliK
MNVEGTEVTNNFGLLEAMDVKKLLAPQVAVAVGDKLLSEDKENIATSLPNTAVKNPEVFASMLNQQGMKIENQTAAVEIKPGPAQHVPDPYNITSQIVDQARLVTGAKNTEMIIQLKPDHLGELTFKVTVENGVISASFHSNNAEVRSIIESSLPQLKQEFFNHGIKTDNIGVYADQGQTFSNGQQSGGYQPPVVKVPNKKTTENFLDVLESTDSVNKASDVTGVDYRA